MKSSFVIKKNRVIDLISKNKADALIFVSGFNRFWLTGANTTFGYVLVTKKEVYYIIDARDYECVKSNLTGVNVVLYNSFNDLINLVNKLKIKKLLFEKDYLSYANYVLFTKSFSKTKLIGVSTAILRASKTNDELIEIKKAMDIAVNTINWIKKTIKVGMTEKQVKQMLTIKMLEQGATATSFDLIVAFGENTANPHHQSTNRKLKKNEFITCDIGCIYNGYCSDITRTFWLGTPSKKMLEIYNLVLKANKLGIQKAKVGIKGKALDKICRDVISSNKKYKDLFTHGTGHGVGVEIHELPMVNKVYDKPILDNSVITIEPGIYEPGFGGVRIEDSILITKNKITVLTAKAPK